MRFRVFNMFNVVLGVAASVAACSPLDDIDQKPALASVSGRIEVRSDSPVPAGGSALRVLGGTLQDEPALFLGAGLSAGAGLAF